jgi:hypothetical protein
MVTFFKALSALALIGALGYLGIHRDILFPITKNNFTSKKVTTTLPVYEETDNAKDTSSDVGTSSIEVPTKEKITLQEKATTTIVQKKSEILTPYTTLTEEKSDSDPTYRPTTSPCQTTLGYTIGRLDPQFGLSKAEFSKEIDMASSVWSNAIQKKLFEYSEGGPLTINLIYDERQVRTENVSNLALEISNAKESADTIRTEYEKEKIDYTAFLNSLKEEAQDFQTKYSAYEAKVESYNARGGAPKAEYDQMMLELTSLKDEGAALEAKRKEMLAKEDSINTKVAKYNEFATYINGLIERSNALGAKKFTEGRFSPNTMTIDIYQYNDTNKLRRVLTHELGHALGINHNTNVRSIMYSVNSATTTALSAEDVKSLYAVCNQ